MTKDEAKKALDIVNAKLDVQEAQGRVFDERLLAKQSQLNKILDDYAKGMTV